MWSRVLEVQIVQSTRYKETCRIKVVDKLKEPTGHEEVLGISE